MIFNLVVLAVGLVAGWYAKELTPRAVAAWKAFTAEVEKAEKEAVMELDKVEVAVGLKKAPEPGTPIQSPAEPAPVVPVLPVAPVAPVDLAVPATPPIDLLDPARS